MKLQKTLVLLALLLSLVPSLRAQTPVALDWGSPHSPSKDPKSIRLKVQVFRLAEAELKKINGGTLPPRVFVVPAEPEQNAAAIVKLGGTVIAEPSLVTTDGRAASF